MVEIEAACASTGRTGPDVLHTLIQGACISSGRTGRDVPDVEV